MKNKNEAKEEKEEEKKRLEIVKAVAQAWLSHSNSAKPSVAEFEAQRRCSFIKGKPSRFKLEASSGDHRPSSFRWDFGQSLWDSYEIVTVSKRLERGLALENSFLGRADDDDLSRLLGPKKRKSRNSLRSLFDRVCSRRFNEADVPPAN